jgi:lysophospholipase L1-like esterase
VLNRCLGEGYTVIEEGLNGRTIGNFLPGVSPLNGLGYLEYLVKRYAQRGDVRNPNKQIEMDGPDVVILYLGINDLFQGGDITISRIAQQLRYAVDLLLDDEFFPRAKYPGVVVLSPLPVNSDIEYAGAYRGEIESSKIFFKTIAEVLKDTPAAVIDTGSIIRASRLDGVHIDGENHVKLGQALCRWLRENRRQND